MPATEGPEDAEARELSELGSEASNNVERAASEHLVPSKKGEETLAATATAPAVTTGRNRQTGRIGALALALQGWLSGKPFSKRDRVKSALINAQNNWANYW